MENILELIFSTARSLWGVPYLFAGLFAVALIVSALGFYRLVYFVSVGYGLSIAALGAVGLALYLPGAGVLALLHGGVLIVYGLRLGGFLLYRDFQTSYRSDEEEVKRAERITSLPLKLTIWISCALLYAVMFAPALFHLAGPVPEDGVIAGGIPLLSLVGVIISLDGIGLESLADLQKNRAKQKEPRRFVSSGIYSLVRQPNYFGEILVWTGSFITAVPYYTTPARWILAVTGYLCIFLIMLGSSKRLELKQERRYGDQEAFRTYAAKTPLLFPLVPVYSLKNWKITLG